MTIRATESSVTWASLISLASPTKSSSTTTGDRTVESSETTGGLKRP